MEPRALRWPGARRVAVGGMAEIWLANDEDGRPVAVKRLLPAYADHPEFVRAFVEEARLLALLDHPNVLHVIDVGVDEEPWLEMEWVDGVDLARVARALKERGRPAPLGLVALVARDLLAALAHVHAARDAEGRPLGLVHRDVSPANLLLRRDGACTLIDFGVAKCAEAPAITRSGSLKGKVAYLAPEQLEGHPLDHRVDLYAAAVVLYELATGKHPFLGGCEGATLRAIAVGGPPSPSSVRPELPERFSGAVLRALAVLPAERFATAGDFAAEALEALPPPLSAEATEEWLAELFPRGLPHELAALLDDPWLEVPAAGPGVAAVTAAPLGRLRLVRAEVAPGMPGDERDLPEVEIVETGEAGLPSPDPGVELLGPPPIPFAQAYRPSAGATVVGAGPLDFSPPGPAPVTAPGEPPPGPATSAPDVAPSPTPVAAGPGIRPNRPRRAARPLLPLSRPPARPDHPPVLYPAGAEPSRPGSEGDGGDGVR